MEPKTLYTKLKTDRRKTKIHKKNLKLCVKSDTGECTPLLSLHETQEKVESNQ